MTGLRFTILFCLIFNLLNVNGQQVILTGLDVIYVYVDHEITIHDYIDQMNAESKTHKIKEVVELTPRKVGKPKVESRCHYNSDCTINYKVDFGWKGGDSSGVFYTYDTLGRLISAINYNSIFGKNDKGDQITFNYNFDNQIVSCITENQITNFSYYPNGNKKSVEIVKFTHLCYPSIRNPKQHIYDTTYTSYFYQYDSLNNLNCILNEKNDTLINFIYDKYQNLIKEISYKSDITNYEHENGVMIKSAYYENEYPTNELTLILSCDYTYINNHLDKCTYKTFVEYMDNYEIQYIYNEKGLLVEKIQTNERGKIDSRTILKYEYH